MGKDVAADPTAKPICHLHTACLTQVVRLLTSHPLPYPRFFYQSLQQTRLKLAVSPQLRAQGEPVAGNTSQFLAVKVEGVIQRSKAVKGVEEGRQVAGVMVMLASALQRPHADSNKASIARPLFFSVPCFCKPYRAEHGPLLPLNACKLQGNGCHSGRAIVSLGQHLDTDIMHWQPNCTRPCRKE